MFSAAGAMIVAKLHLHTKFAKVAFRRIAILSQRDRAVGMCASLEFLALDVGTRNEKEKFFAFFGEALRRWFVRHEHVSLAFLYIMSKCVESVAIEMATILSTIALWSWRVCVSDLCCFSRIA